MATILTGALLGAGIGFIIVGRRGAEFGAIAGAAVAGFWLGMVIAMMALR